MSARGPSWRNARDRAEDVARALNGRRCGSGWICKCPAHSDAAPSSLIADGRHGRPVFFCHAGCDWRDVADALAAKGLAPRFDPKMEGTPMPLTLADYAAAKGLPIYFLASLGVGEETTRNGPRLRIPYQDQDGGEVIARFRHELKGKGFSWPEGSVGRLVLYGQNRLPSAREAGHVVIVEGESDAQTLWFNDLPLSASRPRATGTKPATTGARGFRDGLCGRRG